MNIQTLLNTFSSYLLIFGTVSLVILAIIALKAKKLTAENKKLLFLAIVLVTLIPTLAISFSTVFINVTSSSGGPVHWHADFEVWNCGKEVNLKDPKGLTNKIGTETLHEHNDNRIHLEGVVTHGTDATVSNFFYVVGGGLTQTSFSFPTNDGMLLVQNGMQCPGKGSGEVQMFVYKTDKDNYFSQKKIEFPPLYVIAPEPNVPPADCVIIEFDTPKDRTDKMCRSYKVAEKIGKVKERRGIN